MKSRIKPSGEFLYKERIKSNKTEALFLVLAALFGWLYARRAPRGKRDGLTGFLCTFSAFFIFYGLNYRILTILIDVQALRLTFGIFSWKVPLANITSTEPDHLPQLLRMGGAGIHFMTVRNRYRVSFNFLEYPRVVVHLKQKQGLVQDVSFSTQHPAEVLELLRQHISSIAARPGDCIETNAGDLSPVETIAR